MSGILLYVIGASGSGKDSLMAYARNHLEKDSNIVFAHRYITRPHDAGGENHIALSESEFNARLEQKLFPMHWQSHGMRYGIGSELNHWLAKGLAVVMNGSRAYLSEASRNYPEIVPVLVEVAPEILRARLSLRGRESAADIESRLQRAHEFTKLSHLKLLRFSNNAALKETGPAFVELIRSHAKAIA